jgi:hypothetical protein
MQVWHHTPRPGWFRCAWDAQLVPDFFFLSPRYRGRNARKPGLDAHSLPLEVVQRLEWHASVRMTEMPTNAWKLITLPCVLLALLLLA